jgi:hypothetical protein
MSRKGGPYGAEAEPQRASLHLANPFFHVFSFSVID